MESVGFPPTPLSKLSVSFIRIAGKTDRYQAGDAGAGWKDPGVSPSDLQNLLVELAKWRRLGDPCFT
jgi:hypothetical protein